MKQLNNFINERLQLTKDRVRHIEYTPKNWAELHDNIQHIINESKSDFVNLNIIDVSNIKDFSALFDVNFKTKINEFIFVLI